MADAYTVFTTYEFPNTYAQDPREQVRPKYFRTNNEDWTEAMYLFRQSADLSIDSGTDNQLVLSVSPADLVQDNHYVIVDNGETGASKLVWFVPPAGISSDTITINNTYLADDYTDVSDYDDDITDPSSFRIIVVGAENERLMIDGPNQILNYFADDLEMADDDSDSVATVIGAIEDTLEIITDYTKSSHTAGTEIEEEIVKNEDLDWDNTLAIEGFGNLLENGGFERWRDVAFTGADSSKDISIPGWKFTINSSTTISRESTTIDRGTYALKLDSKGNSDTVYQEIDNYADYQDRWVTLVARVKGTSGRQFKFQIDDGVSATTGDTQTADGDWNTYYIHLQLAAAASELTVKFIRDDGTDSVYYLDNFALYEGRLAKQFALRTLDRVEEQDDRGSKNLLINGSFEMGWPASDESPVGWTFIGLGGAGSRSGAIGDCPGHYAMKFNPTAVGDGIQQPIGGLDPLLNHVKGETVCFSFAALRDSGNSSEWAVKIDDGVGTTTMLFDTSDYDSVTRIICVHDVDSSATKLDVEIYCNDVSNQEDLYIDACCLNIGSRPINDPGAPNNSIWQPYVEVFEQSGTVSSDTAKIGLERLAFNDYYPLWMDVHVSDTATGGDIEFELHKNGSKVMEVELGTGDSEGFATNALSSANSDQIAMGDTYHVEIDLGMGEGCDDPAVHVFGVQLSF